MIMLGGMADGSPCVLTHVGHKQNDNPDPCVFADNELTGE